MNTKNEVDMLHGPLAGKIVLFALPLAASSMLQQLFNAADIAVVGRFASSQAMAAVGSNSSVINLLVGLFVGLSVGANVVLGNLVGAGQRERISDSVHTVMTLALLAGVFLLGVGELLAPAVLRLMGAPESVIRLATLYLRIYFLGMPAILLYNYGAAILRSKGDSRRPFLSLTLAGVVNVLLNLLFVVVFHLHVIGVALATVLSNCLSGGLTVWFLLREEGEFRLDPTKLRVRPDLMHRVVQIGLPAGLQGVVFSFSNVVIQSGINSFGEDCIAGMAAAVNFDFISYSLLNSFSQAAVTFVSQNYGARNKERCRRSLRIAMGFGLGLDLLMIAPIMLFRHTVIRLFSTDADVIHYAMIRMCIEFALHFLCGTYEISGGAIRGMNRSMVPTLISILGTCAFRLVYVLLLLPHFRSPQALIAVYPISWVMTGTAMITAYFLVLRKAFEPEIA